MLVNIKGLSKEAVLAALYNNSKPQGMGFLHFKPGDMSPEEAKQIIGQRRDTGHYFFDYLMGRVMKVDLGGDEVETRLYDRDLGDGAGEAAIAALRG